MIHDRAGMQPYTLKHRRELFEARLRRVRRRFLRLRPGHPAEGRARGAGADGHLHQGPRVDEGARSKIGYDTLLKNPMVDASKVALVGYCFGGMVGVEFGATGAPWSRTSRSTARSSIIRAAGRRRQGHVHDPARGRGRGLPARDSRRSDEGAAHGEGPSSSNSTAAPVTASRCRRPRTTRTPTHARSPPPYADAQGSVRYLSAAGRSARRSREVGRSSRAASRAPMDQRSPARGFSAALALALPLIRFFSVRLRHAAIAI